MKRHIALTMLALAPILFSPSLRTASSNLPQDPGIVDVEGLDVQSLFRTLDLFVQNRALEVGTTIDSSQAKLLQIGDTPVTLTPASSWDPRRLGTVGLLEAGKAFSVQNKTLAAGLYTLEIGGHPQTRRLSLNFRDQFGNIVATLPATEYKFTPLPKRASAKEVEAMQSLLGIIGPAIGFNVVLTNTPPFFKIVPCLGFVVPIGVGLVNVGFCLG
ncbi:MAG: hypothetical protein N0A16_05670 [Blastocatellia bacterium]|nr:hypothetical protein [Blastocatellia bacterium]MCS7157197.1 hypothetical protein [Blastocatellia bacterium]MCX7752340.1 hypothetical protein [Blastocatellia bacterium]MDW8167221.1 hypothetical protein [Acidobacteriota bacterium]